LKAADEAALLALHGRERQAHLQGDAELLASGVGAHLVDSSRGSLQRLSREEFRARFADYFGRVRYSRWDDIEPPAVSVSADGTQAWMAVHIEAELMADAEPRRFESSWIAAYERSDDGWLMVGIASSVVDLD
jgi:Domain of unknown function (DUF4440)